MEKEEEKIQGVHERNVDLATKLWGSWFLTPSQPFRLYYQGPSSWGTAEDLRRHKDLTARSSSTEEEEEEEEGNVGV